METPFGHRWGGDVVRLSVAHIAALQAGQTLAVDVQNEYVVFLKCVDIATADLQPVGGSVENGRVIVKGREHDA